MAVDVVCGGRDLNLYNLGAEVGRVEGGNALALALLGVDLALVGKPVPVLLTKHIVALAGVPIEPDLFVALEAPVLFLLLLPLPLLWVAVLLLRLSLSRRSSSSRGIG